MPEGHDEPEELVPEEIIELDDAREDDSATHPIETVVRGYCIGSVLGRGGMSVVFRVSHPMLQEPLAMKVITDPRLQDEAAVDAIYEHAKTMTTVVCAHVVRTIDAGQLPSGEPFVVMERLDGVNLADHLSEHGPLPLEDAIAYALQLSDGLAATHAAGIVHGDIKPANLVLVRDDTGASCIKIIDFAPSIPRPNEPGSPLVTCSPGYVSPEQLGARDDVDARADVWAVGAVLYELVTGRRAFDANSLAERLNATTLAPPSVQASRRDAPDALDRVIRCCLAREREARYGDASLLHDALLDVLAALVTTTPPSKTRAPSIERATLPAAHDEAPTPVSVPTPLPLPASASPPTAARGSAARVSPRVARMALLGALGPVCALVSMTLVRLFLASHLLHGAAPTPKWPAPVPLTALNSTAENAR